MAVVGTRKRDKHEPASSYCWDSFITDYMWETVNPMTSNSRKSRMRKFANVSSFYKPKYRYRHNILEKWDAIPQWVKDAGLYFLKGLL